MPTNGLLLVAGIEPERVRQSKQTIPSWAKPRWQIYFILFWCFIYKEYMIKGFEGNWKDKISLGVFVWWKTPFLAKDSIYFSQMIMFARMCVIIISLIWMLWLYKPKISANSTYDNKRWTYILNRKRLNLFYFSSIV